MAKKDVKILVENWKHFIKNNSSLLLEVGVTFNDKFLVYAAPKEANIDLTTLKANLQKLKPNKNIHIDMEDDGTIFSNVEGEPRKKLANGGAFKGKILKSYVDVVAKAAASTTPQTQQQSQNQVQTSPNQLQSNPTQQTAQQQNSQQMQLSADENRLVPVVENLLASYRRNLSLENSGLDNSVYSYLRDINDGSRETIMQMIGGQVGDKKFTQTPDDKKKLEQITKKYRSLKDKIAAHARSIGWEVAGDTEGEAWFQVTKTSSAPYQHGSGNFKTYVTFKKDPKKDLEGNFDGEFWNNLNKLIPLIDAINNSNIKPKNRIGFKIAGKFTAGYIDLDNLVIHYKDKNDEILVDNAIKQVGFSTQDRSQYGRMDKGRDVQGNDGKAKSDSQLVSEEVAKNLLAKKNEIEPYFKTYRFTRQHYQNLNTIKQPINEKDIKQGFAKVKQEIYSISKSASHRA